MKQKSNIFKKNRVSFPDEERDEKLNKNLNNNLYFYSEGDDWAED